MSDNLLSNKDREYLKTFMQHKFYSNGEYNEIPEIVPLCITEDECNKILDKSIQENPKPVRMQFINNVDTVFKFHEYVIVEPSLSTLETLVLQWAEDRNIIKGATPQSQFIKLVSELGEVADGILKNNMTDVKDGIGDCLVLLTIISKQLGLDLRECLDHAWNEIKDRQGVMHNGTFIKSTDSNYERILKEIKG